MGADPAIKDTEFPIIFFDGICNLCSGAVKFVIKYDRNKYFKFASLQSSYAEEFFKRHGIENSFDSIVFFQSGKFYTKSEAALEIVRKMNLPWPILYGLKIFPRIIRDFVYDSVARKRYRWFGKSDQCLIPTPEISERFVA